MVDEVIIKEGKAKITIPNPSRYLRRDKVVEPTWSKVFYNPLMTFNRDLSVLVANTYLRLNNKKLRGSLLDALAGTGIRAIRYALESVENADIKCIANDISPEAVKNIIKNVRANNLVNKVQVMNEDANSLMLRSKSLGLKLMYIDIDPFGSAAPFVSASIKSISNNGLIGFTSTDVATLGGTKVSACRRRYAVMIDKNIISDELSLRVLLGLIAREAALHDKSIEVLLAVRRLYYCRIFIKVIKSTSKASDMVLNKLGYIVLCNSCGFLKSVNINEFKLANIHVKCPICKSNVTLIGPIWVGELGDKVFLKELLNNLTKRYRYLQTYRYLKELLRLLLNEVDLGLPYNITVISRFIGKNQPRVDSIIQCLEQIGYRSGKAHYSGPYIKSVAEYMDVLSCVRTSR